MAIGLVDARLLDGQSFGRSDQVNGMRTTCEGFSFGARTVTTASTLQVPSGFDGPFRGDLIERDLIVGRRGMGRMGGAAGSRKSIAANAAERVM